MADPQKLRRVLRSEIQRDFSSSNPGQRAGKWDSIREEIQSILASFGRGSSSGAPSRHPPGQRDGMRVRDPSPLGAEATTGTSPTAVHYAPVGGTRYRPLRTSMQGAVRIVPIGASGAPSIRPCGTPSTRGIGTPAWDAVRSLRDRTATSGARARGRDSMAGDMSRRRCRSGSRRLERIVELGSR